MKITEQNVREILLGGDRNRPVFLYIYAEGPECEAATRAITSAISDENEYVTLALADVKDEVAQALALQLGLQGVPCLTVLKGGRPLEMLMGDEIVELLPKLLQKYLPSELELKIKSAQEHEQKGEIKEALADARAARRLDPASSEAKLLLASLCLADRNLTEARELLENPTREERDSQHYQDLLSALSIAEEAQDTPELKELQRKHAEHPKDEEIARQLCVALAAVGKKGEALSILFALLQEDLSREAVKKAFLDILSTMAGDPLQKDYRRRFYTLLH
ncbi:MAG: tetratricopeptide repeat protein [Succinivibrionaceae bacterium]|nr:tetratricopeptide repeat protein [Succinivibrionaceae bacterium]